MKQICSIHANSSFGDKNAKLTIELRMAMTIENDRLTAISIMLTIRELAHRSCDHYQIVILSLIAIPWGAGARG